MSQPRNRELSSGAVDLWSLDLTDQGDASANKGILGADELERAARFRQEADRNRFLFVHVALRTILASYLGLAPGELGFASSPMGKPRLASPQSRVRFSVSHSRARALIAITYDREIGVDVEFVRKDLEVDNLAERFFSPYECRLLSGLPCAERISAFFQIWTAKEAFVKALGQGLSLPLSSFDVGFSEETGVRLIATRPNPVEALRWKVQTLPVEFEYKASVATDGDVGHLCWVDYRSC